MNAHVFAIRKWLSVFLLTFIALALLLPWPAFFRAFLFAGVFPLIFWVIFRHRSFPELKNPVFISAGSFVLYGILSGFLSADLSTDDQFQGLRWGLTTLFFCAAVVIATQKWLHKPEFYARLMFSIVLLAGSFAIARYIWLGEFPSRISGFGFLGHPILGSSALIGIWAVASMLFLSSGREKPVDWIVLASSLVVLCCYVFLSQSRGAMIAFSIFLISVFLISLRNSGNRSARKYGLVVFVGLFILASIFMVVWTDVLLNMIERGASYRPEIWASLINNPPPSIWFGAGASADFSISAAGVSLVEDYGFQFNHPHNIVLGVYFYSGLVGVFLLLLFLGLLVRSLLLSKGPGLKAMRPFIFCLLVLTLLLNSTDGHRVVAPPSADWMFFWFPLSFIVGFLWYLKESPSGDRAV